jgi:hypothetical protein
MLEGMGAIMATRLMNNLFKRFFLALLLVSLTKAPKDSVARSTRRKAASSFSEKPS